MLKTTIRLVVPICVCAQLVGCADLARRVRPCAYPPDFRYIERERLRSAMWRLAYHMRELGRAVNAGKAPQELRAEILEPRAGMDAACKPWTDRAGSRIIP